MKPVQSPEVSLRLRHIARPWRIVFILYALAMTIGTHWPNLQFSSDVPTSDKTVHLAAFAALTVLLWQTRWVAAWWLLGVMMIAWALVDETTQGIPALNRSVSLHDFIANVLGVVIAMSWIWAQQPTGVPGGASRMRHQLRRFVFDEMFTTRRAWLLPCAACAMVAVGLITFKLLLKPGSETMRIAVVIAIAACGVSSYLLLHVLWNKTLARVMRNQPCLDCGSESGIRSESTGVHRCAACGLPASPAVWETSPQPTSRILMHIGLRPALIGFGSLAIIFAAIFFFPVLYAYVLNAGQGGWGMPRAARFIGSLPPELERTFDLAALLLLIAVVVRVYRYGLSRFYDQASRCVKCGHDLRGTPTSQQGIGRCGECGSAFVRSTPQQNSQKAPIRKTQ